MGRHRRAACQAAIEVPRQQLPPSGRRLCYAVACCADGTVWQLSQGLRQLPRGLATTIRQPRYQDQPADPGMHVIHTCLGSAHESGIAEQEAVVAEPTSHSHASCACTLSSLSKSAVRCMQLQ